ncbi:MAG: hypothetical protein KC912_22960 [Proteobacteria bacterium]|nr:hypothetical protein [Pseudomonadota bacterium]
MLAFALVCLLTACGESPRSYGIQHDVGRLCAAWKACDGSDCTRYASERGRMMSTWGKGVQSRLAAGEAEALSELASMVERSGAAEMSASCSALRAAVPEG